jgi:hypothetical protein
VTYVCILLRQGMLSLGLCYSILTILVQALSVIGSCTHNHTIYSVCSHGNQHICFKPTYRPWEQWLEIRSIHNPGNFISATQEYSPDKPVSMLFYTCAVICRGGCGDTGCSCGGLAWEIAYTSNDVYVPGRQLLAM